MVLNDKAKNEAGMKVMKSFYRMMQSNDPTPPGHYTNVQRMAKQLMNYGTCQTTSLTKYNMKLK